VDSSYDSIYVCVCVCVNTIVLSALAANVILKIRSSFITKTKISDTATCIRTVEYGYNVMKGTEYFMSL
jgi:hypothetical protein